jgi:hypothetical protein
MTTSLASNCDFKSSPEAEHGLLGVAVQGSMIGA